MTLVSELPVSITSLNICNGEDDFFEISKLERKCSIDNKRSGLHFLQIIQRNLVVVPCIFFY